MAKSNSPLSGTKRKKRSYVGNLDDLMADVSEEGSEKEPASSEGDEAPQTQDSPAGSPKAEEVETSPKKHLNLKINEKLHARFKGIVGMQGRTMTDVLEELMQGYVRESASELDL